MTLEEHNTIINSIVKEEDSTKRQTLLLQLSDDYKTMTADIDKLKSDNETVSKERDNYAKLNNELWLRTTNKDNEPTDNNDNEQHAPKRSYESLNFD